MKFWEKNVTYESYPLNINTSNVFKEAKNWEIQSLWRSWRPTMNPVDTFVVIIKSPLLKGTEYHLLEDMPYKWTNCTVDSLYNHVCIAALLSDNTNSDKIQRTNR